MSLSPTRRRRLTRFQNQNQIPGRRGSGAFFLFTEEEEALAGDDCYDGNEDQASSNV